MEVAIALDTYDDLFSDFDIRSYAERAISRDFLDELQLRLRKAGTATGIDLVLLIPGAERKADEESLITERIRLFFEERRAHYLLEDRRSKRRSALFVTIGLTLSLAANAFADRLSYLPLFKDFLLIPAWFFVWNGLEPYLKSKGEIGRKKAYYGALSRARVDFRDIEEYRKP